MNYINGPTVRVKIAVAVASDGRYLVWNNDFPKTKEIGSFFWPRVSPPQSIAYSYVWVDVPLPIQHGLSVGSSGVEQVEADWTLELAVPERELELIDAAPSSDNVEGA